MNVAVVKFQTSSRHLVQLITSSQKELLHDLQLSKEEETGRCLLQQNSETGEELCFV